MILRTLHLSGFGVFCDEGLPDLAPGLNIIEGPNEAGKSTTVEFIRSLLFGFQIGANKRIYEPQRGGDHGGWALVRDRQGREYRWELKARKNAAAGQRLITELGGNSALDPGMFLGGADRKLFSNIFAFSLEEMAALEVLQEEGVHSRIYAAASGGGGASLFTAGHSVDRQLAELFRPRAPSSMVNNLLRERKELAAKLERLSGRVEQFNQAKERHTDIEAALVAVRSQESEHRDALSKAEAAASAWDSWLELRDLRAELETLSEIVSFPDEGLARLQVSLQALQSQKERIAETEGAVETLVRRLDECRINGALLEVRETLQALTERQSEYLSARRDCPTVAQSRDRAAREGADALGRLGPGWTEEKLRRLDRSIGREGEIRAHRDTLDRISADLRAQEDRVTTADEHLTYRCNQLDDAAARLDAAYPEPPPALPDHAARARALDAAESLFRQSVEHQAELRPLRDRLADLEQRRGEGDGIRHAATPALPSWLGVILLAACLGVAALAYGNVPLQIGLGLLGVFLCGGWFWLAAKQSPGAARTQQSRSGGGDSYREQRQALLDRLEDVEEALTGIVEQVRTLLAPFGVTCDSAEAVREMQRELADLVQSRERYENDRRTLEVLEREVETARDDLDKTRQKRDTLREEHHSAGELWKAWLSERELPTEVGPETALRLFDEASRALKCFDLRNDEATRVKQMAAVIDRFEAEAGALCRRLERPEPSPEEIVATLRSLTQEADRQSNLALRREELTRQRADADAALSRLRIQLEEMKTSLADLLALAGVTSEEAFREKARAWARKRELLVRRQELERFLDGVAGAGAKREALETLLADADPQALARQCEESRRAVAAIEETRNSLQSELGGILNELSRLEKSDEITGKQRELAAKDAEIAEASQQWAVLRLTSWLLEQTRKKFETERQPAVIRNAGSMMTKLTGGRYSAVVAPQGLAEVALQTPAGERKTLEAWSRGTREQLYLALRFAFVQDYSLHSEPLPIIMDDVLVHADGYQRRRWAAETIAEVAQGCQVLYFTCHPDHAELLADACPGAHRYRLENASFNRIGARPPSKATPPRPREREQPTPPLASQRLLELPFPTGRDS